MPNSNNLIWITGASSGIGLATTEKFARKGWTVLATSRKLAVLKKLSIEKNIQGRIIPLKLDIIKKNDVEDFVKKNFKKYGIPEVCFLNAGTHLPDNINSLAIEPFKYLIDVNLIGTINCAYSSLPFMFRRGRGQLVLMSSVAGYIGLPYANAYCASKAAIKSVSESLYWQCLLKGINVRLVSPGFVKTPLTNKNDFHMPFLMEVEDAAEELFKKITKGRKFEIKFPTIFVFIMKFLSILPYPLYFRICKSLLKK